MSKRKKIIVIAVAVTLALVMGVGGLVFAQLTHGEFGGHKLIGVGKMGYGSYSDYNNMWDQDQRWDTQFIITNPNCEKDLTIEWVALIAGEDVIPSEPAPPYRYAEEVIFEGTPQMWHDKYGIEIPGNLESERGVLSPHEVWQVSIAELIGEDVRYDPERVVLALHSSKYTLEVTWNGARYSWWSGWGKLRPLAGWQKEKCWSEFFKPGGVDVNFAISEAEMQLFPSKMRFRLPEIEI